MYNFVSDAFYLQSVFWGHDIVKFIFGVVPEQFLLFNGSGGMLAACYCDAMPVKVPRYIIVGFDSWRHIWRLMADVAMNGFCCGATSRFGQAQQMPVMVKMRGNDMMNKQPAAKITTVGANFMACNIWVWIPNKPAVTRHGLPTYENLWWWRY